MIKIKRDGSFQKFSASLGEQGMTFLENALGAILRLLPHTTLEPWKVSKLKSPEKTRVFWVSYKQLELRLVVVIEGQDGRYSLESTLSKAVGNSGAWSYRHALDAREVQLAKLVCTRISGILKLDLDPKSAEASSLVAIRAMFDEQVVAQHLEDHHNLKLDVAEVFRSLRELSEQSYENKALSFGCLLDSRKKEWPSAESAFPKDVLIWKRYKALSDGFRTAYRVSTHGKIVGFEDLRSRRLRAPGKHYFPDWAEHLAAASVDGTCGVCLTRQGDLLIFEEGTLRFTYRFGRWQYWNHDHLVNLLFQLAIVQRVPVKLRGRVVRSVYAAALDISFRRSGGLFVVLRNQNFIGDLVGGPDMIDGGGASAAGFGL